MKNAVGKHFNNGTTVHQIQAGRHRQAGMGIIGAIFLITVVAVLAVAITRTVRTSGEAFALEVMSSRAFLAAESGAQLAVREIYPASGAGVCADAARPLDQIGLRQCTANTQCRVQVTNGVSYYTVESAGRCTDGADVIAERVVLVRTRS